MASALSYKKNFKVSPALQLFYTGGPVVVSPDEKTVACACTDDVKVVELATGVVVKTFKGDTEPITAIVYSPDGNTLFAASRSLQIKHWDLSSQACLRSWKAHDAPVVAMSVDASGGLLATASADRRVLVWDIEGGFCTHAFKGHTGVVSCVQFHPDIHRLLLFSGSDDGTVRVWDLVTKTCAAILNKHFSAVTSLDVSRNGWTLVSAGRDKVVNVWNLRDYSLQIAVPIYEAIETVLVLPEGCGLPGCSNDSSAQKKSGQASLNLLTVGERGIVSVWNTAGATCLYKQKVSDATVSSKQEDAKGGFVAAAWLPSQGEVMCVTADQRLLFYTSDTQENDEKDLKLARRLIGYNEEIIDLKFLGDGDSSLAVATNLEQVRVYDMTTMTCQQELVGHTDIVLSLDSCVTTAGVPLLASSSKDHSVRIWNASTGSCLAVAAGHMAAVGAVAFSKKKKNFVVSGSSDRTIKFWNIEALVAAEDITEVVKLSSQAVAAAHEKDINSLAVAPNDSLLCSGSQDRTAKVWRLPGLTPVFTLKGHKRGVWCVEFSPVDQAVLTSSGDMKIKIWSLVDGSCLKTFEGHTASVLKCSFITRGTQLVSAGADGLVKLWTIKTNECVNTFDHHEDKIWALAVSSGTEKLATGGGDSVVNMWTDCTVDDEEEAIRQEEEEALKDQDLSNALADTDWVKAVQLAFELRRPFRVLKVFTELLGSEGADVHTRQILQSLDKDYWKLMLEYIRDWNTKPKSCHVAQRVLHEFFSVVPVSKIVEIPQVRELMEGIIPYTKRHSSRIDRLSRSIFLLDYTLARMNVLIPVDNLSGPEIKDAADLTQGTSWPIVENLNRMDVSLEEKETTMTDANGVHDGKTFDQTEDEMVDAFVENGREADANCKIKNVENGSKSSKSKKKRKGAGGSADEKVAVEDGLRTPEPNSGKKKKTSSQVLLNSDAPEAVVEVEPTRDGLTENGGDKNDSAGDDDATPVQVSNTGTKLGRKKKKSVGARRKSLSSR
ncbi:protein TORMOZ EMBRYO DEFECTIVE [Physcomitrium patens]|uniref:U3 small nucleolar RNA-associated protein 13 C-terminal domain-containing protein n=1 Tax=Physcomitrium patens TaxID=3218 RepID=A9TRZ2_PHYPA|nr:transducin beta-like protein 3 [Physcomitrium patens]PNR34219.1 hypothetical protein PHYPA_024036 [Physcomitrium patens]|eukprot:XP_024403982.1 transducin beta-like protein 3 [Physcomitrella patens]